MRNKIIEIIYEISENEDFKNNPDLDLFENEIIDSMGFLELISKIEETFNIELYPSQIPSKVWRNVNLIANMVEEYLGEKNGEN